MTIWFYIHSIAKRAEAVALLDSGATENFLNLSYAKWLRLPIKQLPSPCTLLNVDGTENTSVKFNKTYHTYPHLQSYLLISFLLQNGLRSYKMTRQS